MKTPIFAFVIILVIIIPLAAQPDWYSRLKRQSWLDRVNKIELLKSDKTEATKILGEPEKFDYQSADFIEYYYLKNGEVILSFTTNECKSSDGIIKKGLVEEVLYSPEIDIPFTSLKIPLQEFSKSVESDVPSLFIYTNETNGVKIYVQFGKINSIIFFVPKQKQLDCSND